MHSVFRDCNAVLEAACYAAVHIIGPLVAAQGKPSSLTNDKQKSADFQIYNYSELVPM